MTLEKTRTVEEQLEGVWGDGDIVPLTMGLWVASLLAMEKWSCAGKR